MKKMSKFVFAMMVFACVFFYAHGLDAKIVSVSGKVEIQSGSSWVAAKVGDVVPKGTVISTGFKSSAVLSIDSTSVSVGPLTRMTIEQLASNSAKDEAALYLDSGTVSANVKKSEGRRVDFRVSSPVATASVRGTEFTMSANGKLTTYEGLVSKGAPTSFHADVSESDAPSDFLSEEGESSATTPTSEVSGSFGVPVFAGQTSRTDVLTGIATAPQAEQRAQSQSLADGTASLSAREKSVGVSTGLGDLKPVDAKGDFVVEKLAPTTGTVIIVLEFPD